jgi:methyl-accepting chemotaxis protein
MNDTRKRRKWRNILVYPQFQLRLALVHLGFVFLIVLAFAAALFAPLYFSAFLPGDIHDRYATSELLFQVFNRMGVVIVLIIVCSAIYHIIFSHRLCGPLVNMGHTIDSVINGDLTRKIYLRQKDFLTDEAERLNIMVATLETKINVLKANHDNLASQIALLNEGDHKNKLQALLNNNSALLNQWVTSPLPGQRGM